MKIKILIVFLVLFFSLNIFSQEKSNTNKEQMAKGKQIVEDARKEIGADKLISNLGSFQLSMKSQSELGEFVILNTKEISVMLPNKILSVYTTTKPLESTETSIWNGEKYKKLLEIVTFDGRRNTQDVTNQEWGSSLGKFVKDSETLEKIKKARAAINPKVRMNDNLWNEIFPLILTHPFETQVEFKYVGKAESANREANIVDTTSQGGRAIRFFFDSKTNQLLMMIEKYNFFDGDYETKYYYSNRELVDNVLIPKKIKVEYRFTPTGKDTKVTYKYIDVVEFKINPKFKPNLFDVN